MGNKTLALKQSTLNIQNTVGLYLLGVYFNIIIYVTNKYQTAIKWTLGLMPSILISNSVDCMFFGTKHSIFAMQIK